MRTQVVGPPDDDFHHFPRCVFLVFVSVVHLRFMLQFFFHIRFAHTRLGFFPTRPDIKLCYAGCFAKRAQSGVARQVLLRRVRQPCQILKSNPGGDFPTFTLPGATPPPPAEVSCCKLSPVREPPGATGKNLLDPTWRQDGPKIAAWSDFVRSWTQRRPQDRRLQRFLLILDPSWRQLRTTSYGQGAKMPQPSQNTTPKS